MKITHDDIVMWLEAHTPATATVYWQASPRAIVRLRGRKHRMRARRWLGDFTANHDCRRAPAAGLTHLREPDAALGLHKTIPP